MIQILPMDKVICVGFGAAYVSCNGETVWEEEYQAEFDTLWRVQDAEEMAKEFPEEDWRIHIVGPLSEGHWKRESEGQWVLYESGPGFA